MHVVSFNQDAFSGEEALVQELDRKIGTNQSTLQRCNDGGEVIYARFNEMSDGKMVVDERGRVKSAIAPMKYRLLKRALRATKTISFVTVDTFRNERIMPINEPKVAKVVLVGEVEEPGRGGASILFFGEGMNDDRKGHLKESKSVIAVIFKAVWMSEKETWDVVIPCATRKDADALVVEITKVFGGGKIFLVSGMEMPDVVSGKDGLDREKVHVFINEYSIFDDSFEDVAALIPKINTWEDLSLWRDLGTGVPFYDREVNEILTMNVCYVRQGRSVFNLILSGKPSSAKTSCAIEYARVFGDGGKIIQAQGSTTKGLIPSFSGDESKPGCLSEPGFLKVVDEIFRHSSSQHENKGMNSLTDGIGQLLSRLLPILTRKAQNYASGKDQDFTVQMTAALLATDNLKDDVRVALANQVANDPAVLRRFTMIFLGDREYERMKLATIVPADDEVHDMTAEMWMKTYGFNVMLLKRFAEWFRKAVEGVRADSKRCLELSDKVLGDALVKALGDSLLGGENGRIKSLVRKIDFVDHVRALVECSALMRVVYATTEERLPRGVVVEDVDYIEAERIFGRIVSDCTFLFSSSIQPLTVETTGGFGGVRRT